MKKIKFASWLLIVTIFMGLIPARAEVLKETVITTTSGMFLSKGSWGSSSLTGYNNTSSLYDAEDNNVEAIFKPMLLNGGKYHIYFYNMVHSTNTETIVVEVHAGDDVASFEIPHKDGEPGFVDLGEYELPAGDTSFVSAKKLKAGGFIRVNAVKFDLIEKSETSKSLVETNESEYPGYETRELPKKDVQIPSVKENAVKIFVQNGAGSGDGSFEKPFGTIAEAQSKYVELKTNGQLPNGAAIVFRGGVYSLDESLVIDDKASGTSENPLFYMPYNDEEVTITAGKNISSDIFKKVTDKAVLDKIPTEGKEHLYEADLSLVGLRNIPNMNLRTSTPYVLVMGDQRGTLARWPNEGYGKTGEVIDTGARGDSGPRKKGFTYEITDSRLLRWKDAQNGWVNGYWMTPYTIDYASIAKIDADNMRIVGKDWNGLGNYGYARYFAENLLEEIDREGEWYLDNENNKLYFYPYAGYETADIKFAASNYPIIQFKGANNVVVSGLNIEVGGSVGVSFDEQTSDCMLIGSNVQYVSSNGIGVNGKNNIVRDCDVSYVGAVGIAVSGGVPEKLVQGGNLAENNEVHNTGTGGGSKQGITINGCGNRVANNHIYDIPTHGITGGGMEQIIEKNIIERTNLEMGDTGGLYFINYGLGYGTKIRYNIVKDSVGLMPVPGFSGEGCLGIYIDDVTSGLEIYGNVVYNAKEPGTFIHGGRYNKIYNNMYINCDVPIRVIKTGIAKSIFPDPTGTVWQNLEKYKVTEGPIKEKYPQAAATFTDSFGDPLYDEVYNNVSFNGGSYNFEECLNTYKGQHSGNVTFDGYPDCNMTDFMDMDYTKIKEACPDFEPIPFEDIGTYNGGARKSEKSIIFDNRAEEFSATYPINNSHDVPVETTFKWEKGAGGIRSYEVLVAEDPEFKDLVYYESSTDGECPMKLEYGKTYYWRVKANPMLKYESRWNTNGVMSFSTINAKDVLYGEYLLSKAFVNSAQEGSKPGMYPIGSKEALNKVMNEALEAINSEDDEKMISMISALKTAKEEFMVKRIADSRDLTTLVYDDFENDTIGERPAGLFFRSYSPLNVKVSQDPKNTMNKVFECRDEETTHQYGNRFFDPQDGYVEMSVSVMPCQTTGSFSLGLYKTGNYTTQQGTTGSCAARIVFANDSYIYDGTARKTQLMKYQPNEWYDIKAALNLNEKYCDIYINGNLVKEKAELDVSSVTSVNQFIFDTTDGTSSASAHRGGFYMDNLIVRAPKAKGANPYLMSIKLDGEEITGFEPEKTIYDVNMTIEELNNARLEYVNGKNANVMVWKGENGLYLTVISGDSKHGYTYFLRPSK